MFCGKPHDKVLDRLIEGELKEGDRHWEHIHLDLTTYRKQPVIVRLYDFILVPNLQAGNSYWRHIEVQ